jgi:hypothetical protein
MISPIFGQNRADKTAAAMKPTMNASPKWTSNTDGPP